jgi:hypothetical protein
LLDDAAALSGAARHGHYQGTGVIAIGHASKSNTPGE